MKKIALTLIFSVLVFSANGQTESRFNYAITAGSGLPLTVPAATSFELQAVGLYNVNQRFAAGVGVGLSSYESVLFPVFADTRFFLACPRKFTPFVECALGYAFTTSHNTFGGLYFHPSLGMQYAVNKHIALLMHIGYEQQALRRRKVYESDYFVSEFEESLSHGSVMFQFGVCFW